VIVPAGLVRRSLAVAAALLLTGCNSANDSTYMQYYQVVKQSVSASFGDSSITRAQAAAIPYASMGWRLDGGQENLIVLATDTGGDRLWTSAAHVVLLTHDGRILRTVGLPHDIAATTPANGQILPSPADVRNGAYVSTRLVDFPDIGHYGVAITCRTAPAGHETITILGQQLDTLKAVEACRSNTLDWSFKDSYWLDPSSGFVWRSVQHLHPKGETIETEILRPPS
jgi:hypothetical protein